MLSPVSDAFLDSVLKRILWRGEHAAIREELSAHLEDHIQALVEQGTDPAEAERRAVAAMGDPAEIGLQLNRQHRPFLGWAVRFTGIVAKISGCIVALFCIFTALVQLGDSYRSLFDTKIDAGDVPLVWEMEIDQQQTMDNRVVTLKRAAYTEEGDLLLLGASRLRPPYRQGWSYSCSFTSILDEKGREYQVGSRFSGGGIFQLKIHDFPSDANRLTLVYDLYNRQMEFQLDLPQKSEGEA